MVDADIIKELRNTLRQNVCQAAEKAHTQSSITTLQWLILASLIIEFCEEEDIFRFRLASIRSDTAPLYNVLTYTLLGLLLVL